MRPEQNNNEEIINKAIKEIRNDTPPPEAVAESSGPCFGEKLSSELQGGGIGRAFKAVRASAPSCRPIAPEELSEARALLVRDHLHECIACRKEFMRGCPAFRNKGRTAGKPRFSVPRWAVAAAVVLGRGPLILRTVPALRPAARRTRRSRANRRWFALQAG